MTALHLRPIRKRKRPNWLQINPKRANYDQVQTVRKQFQIEKGGTMAVHQPTAQRNNIVVKRCLASTPTRLNHVRLHVPGKGQEVHIHFTPTRWPRHSVHKRTDNHL
ncbi:hypothetical protein CSKR_201094 [Clonorchis sinensis]|uniref:Uncharacterized protein n=1 Tax=Clonorchis sinensis TaxID=79923 RepID=A0A8T1MM43_CLOSI|nr:hypothetical protein CSKR_201094 [Clonorchis sinensis]